MRTLADPETGELVEVLDEQSMVSTAEPYSYEAFRRAAMTVSREHKAAVNAAERAGKDVAVATANYHKAIAIVVPQMKAEHGATNAELMAKGDPDVRQRKEELLIAEAVDRAAMERVRLARDDRAALLVMGAWSRATEDWQ